MRSAVVAVLVGLGLVGCPQKQVTAPPPVAQVASPQATPTTPGALPEMPKLRLPRTFLPTAYAARLDIDPAKPTFGGSIAISGVIEQPASVLWLHGKNLEVAKATATKETQEIALKVTKRGEDLLMLEAAQPLAPGAWTLLMDYTGELETRSTAGAFKQTINDATYVYTQLEALYARRVFPCLDEPDSKVPWKLTLDVPKQLMAVANAPMVSEAPLAGDKKRVEFAVTKPLPSYLIAFGVGPFEVVDAGKSKAGTPIRILALAKRSADAAFAAKTAAKIVDLAEEWFGMPYPYEKLDLLTIPITIGFGAMENAGLVTFTETLILLDPQASKGREHRWVVVAAHEIAHQWFGNYVTMRYWDDIWLNEGFASWVAAKISAKFDPSWHDELGDLDTRNSALGADSLVSARRIRQPIVTEEDVLNVFDGITYNKGSAVLDMFESYTGDEAFQRGVREHLKSRAWGNATSADFAATMSTVTGKPLESALASFLDHAGAPEITATLACKDKRIELAQRRYVPPGSPGAAGGPWTLPVCVAYDRDGKRAQACTLLAQATGVIALEGKACPRWVMPNVDGRGYYRSPYTAPQLTALRDEAWKQLSWNERRAVYFDVVESVRAGRIPLTLALSFVPKLLAGNDRFTIGSAMSLVIGIDAWVPTELRGKYEHWLRQTYGPGAVKVGLVPKDSDSLDIERTRGDLINAVAWTAREPTLVAEAVKLSDSWRDLPQGIRGTVLAIAADAKPEVFDRILRDVRTETDRSRRQEMYGALGSVRDLKQQARALALVLEPTLDIRETQYLLYGSTGELALAAAQAFFRTHKDEIMKRLPQDGTTDSLADFSWLFTTTCKADQRDAVADYVTATFSKYPGAKHVLQQNLEQMDQCIAKRKVLDPEIRGWLSGVKLPRK